MNVWEERITRGTNAAIRVEHDARYRMAAPAIRAAPVWCDLGCGNGIAAASALDGRFDGRMVLVDLADEALDHARRELQAADTVTLRADLAAEEDLRRVRDAVLDGGPDGGCVTCFEVAEHLTSFVPLIEMLVGLARHHGFTVALSVPNDAFWSIENPFHHTMWGEGAFEELRRLLPEDHVVARQVALHGSLIQVEGAVDSGHSVEVEPPTGTTPTHFLVVFGPGATLFAGTAQVGEADLVEQRRWERQRESDLAFLKALESKLRGEVRDFREYIHELERRLGLPLSGSGDHSA